MSESNQISRNFITEFLALYGSFPCLWHIRTKEYTDEKKKQEAYDILVKKLREIDRTATLDTVIKNIDFFRYLFRKELHKIRKSQKAGGPPYEPQLWFFKHMAFLMDQDEYLSKPTNKDCADCQRVNESDIHQYGDAALRALDIYPVSHNGEVPSRISHPDKLGKSQTRNGEEYYKLRCPHHCEGYQYQDDFSIYGTSVASRLRESKQGRQSVAIAKNKIDNILFQLEMGEMEQTPLTDGIKTEIPTLHFTPVPPPATRKNVKQTKRIELYKKH